MTTLTTLTPEQIANREKWITALRSGKYGQTRGALHRKRSSGVPVGYCCLGVYCDLKQIPTLKDRSFVDMFDFGDRGISDTSIPHELFTEWFGVFDNSTSAPNDINHFIQFNDINRLSFTEIADIIEWDTAVKVAAAESEDD